MIVKETKELYGKMFDYIYSDLSVYLKSTINGNLYVNVYGECDSGVENRYTETDKKIETEQNKEK